MNTHSEITFNPFGYFQHEDNIYSDYYHHTVAKKILSYCNKLENKEDILKKIFNRK